MGGFASVVVGYDGSPDARLALRWAADLARLEAAPLRVVTAVGELRLRHLTHLQAGSTAEHESALVTDARAAVDALGLDAASLEVVEDAPAPALLQAAGPATVLVVGSRGRGRVAGALSGSVSQHAGRHAPCPVVVVRAPADPAATRVVVAVDGSPGCRPALTFAFDYADLTGAELVATFVLSDLDGAFGSPARHSGEHRDTELGVAEPVLSHALGDFPKRYPRVRVREELLVGSVVRTLAESSEHAALLAVGSRGHGGFSGLLLGSVGQGLLHEARCPLVIAR